MTISLYHEAFISGMHTARMRIDASAELNSAQARGLNDAASNYTHKIGALAEVAFSLAAGYEYKHSCNEWHAPDFVSPKTGLGIDVKASKYSNLLVSATHLKRERIFAAVKVISEKEFRLIGWITGEEIAANADKFKANPDNRGACYIVPSYALHAFPHSFATKRGRNQ